MNKAMHILHSDRPVFVFGSNLLGIHGAGSAREAYLRHGALHGCGFGYMYNNRGHSFAIPTKHSPARKMTTSEIAMYIEKFVQFAANNPNMKFEVVDIGCGLAGYTHEDIAPLFVKAVSNRVTINGEERWAPMTLTNVRFLGRLHKHIRSE